MRSEDAADVQLLLTESERYVPESTGRPELSALVTVGCGSCLRHIMSCAFFLSSLKETLKFPQSPFESYKQ